MAEYIFLKQNLSIPTLHWCINYATIYIHSAKKKSALVYVAEESRFLMAVLWKEVTRSENKKRIKESIRAKIPHKMHFYDNSFGVDIYGRIKCVQHGGFYYRRWFLTSELSSNQ